MLSIINKLAKTKIGLIKISRQITREYKIIKAAACWMMAVNLLHCTCVEWAFYSFIMLNILLSNSLQYSAFSELALCLSVSYFIIYLKELCHAVYINSNTKN